jgi:glycosyltransferase involved in cell wall biosynthesis
MIVFVQPFGLNSPGGGPRILRALLKDAPVNFLSVCTSLLAPPSTSIGPEVHFPIRRHFGRIESTRLAPFAWHLARRERTAFCRDLEKLCAGRRASVIHAIPHGLEFWHAFEVARKLGIRYVLNVHDELDYNLRNRPDLSEAKRQLEIVWKRADARFVISEPMGEEYCRRYGNRRYEIVTDGLLKVPEFSLARPGNNFRVYFMGALHLSYEPNFLALQEALNQVVKASPETNVRLCCRGSSLPKGDVRFPVTILPWGSEEDVAQDIDNADLLYLPLPFDKRHESFYRYSLSTKMITYLGSGIAMLYHGPADAAAGRLLAEKRAGLLWYSLSPTTGFELLTGRIEDRRTTAENALKLGRTQFHLSDQRLRFWSTVLALRTIDAGPIRESIVC